MPLPHEYLPATGPAEQDLVLLHGWGCNREVWRALLLPLRPWANITLLDLPGCAPGPAVGATPELPELLTSILDCSPRHAVYVGWSLGGQLAMALAARHPQRVQAVVSICSNPLFVAAADWPGMDADVFREFLAAVQAHPVAALKRFDSLQAVGAQQPRRLLRQLQQQRRPPASPALLAGLGWLQTLDCRASLATLRQPQLHLLAEHDAVVPCTVSRSIASRLVNGATGEVKVLHHTSHLAPVEIPEELALEIRGFLAATGSLRTGVAVTQALEKQEVAASFSRAASGYDSVARLQRDVGVQLLDHLDGWPREPQRILDLGCGTGHFCPHLRGRFPGAQYVGLDLASGMVDFARSHSPVDCDWLVADAESLPLASASVDLVFSSMAVQWCSRPDHLFAELARVLRPGGWCVFTSLGPGTLCELRAAWATVDEHQHVNNFLPAATLAAAAERIPGVTLHLSSRAMRMEYARVRELLDELKTLGAHNMNRSRPVGLTGRRALQGMLQAYEARRSGGILPATYEVIFGVLEKA